MDKIFKIGLLVLGFSYLAYLFCPVANQVGRYSFRETGSGINILDTTNADLYTLPEGSMLEGWRKLNIRTGKYEGVKYFLPPKEGK